MRSFFDDELVVNRRCSKLGCALYFSCGLSGGVVPSIFKKKKKKTIQNKTKNNYFVGQFWYCVKVVPNFSSSHE